MDHLELGFIACLIPLGISNAVFIIELLADAMRKTLEARIITWDGHLVRKTRFNRMKYYCALVNIFALEKITRR